MFCRLAKIWPGLAIGHLANLAGQTGQKNPWPRPNANTATRMDNLPSRTSLEDWMRRWTGQRQLGSYPLWVLPSLLYCNKSSVVCTDFLSHTTHTHANISFL